MFDVREFLRLCMLRFDAGLDTSSGSDFDTIVATPFVNFMTQPDPEMDIVSFMRARLQELHPEIDYSKGSELEDLMLNPASSIIDPAYREVASLRNAMAFSDMANLPTDAVDQILSVFGVSRTLGSKARGTVRLAFRTPEARTLLRASGTLSLNGLYYYPVSPMVFISEITLQQNKISKFYTATIEYEAAEEGSQYTVAKGTSLTATGDEDIVFAVAVTNLGPGRDTQSNSQLYSEVRGMIFERSPNTSAGLIRLVKDLDPTLGVSQVSGYGDPEMARDIMRVSVTNGATGAMRFWTLDADFVDLTTDELSSAAWLGVLSGWLTYRVEIPIASIYDAGTVTATSLFDPAENDFVSVNGVDRYLESHELNGPGTKEILILKDFSVMGAALDVDVEVAQVTVVGGKTLLINDRVQVQALTVADMTGGSPGDYLYHVTPFNGGGNSVVSHQLRRVAQDTVLKTTTYTQTVNLDVAAWGNSAVVVGGSNTITAPIASLTMSKALAPGDWISADDGAAEEVLSIEILSVAVGAADWTITLASALPGAWAAGAVTTWTAWRGQHSDFYFQCTLVDTWIGGDVAIIHLDETYGLTIAEFEDCRLTAGSVNQYVAIRDGDPAVTVSLFKDYITFDSGLDTGTLHVPGAIDLWIDEPPTPAVMTIPREAAIIEARGTCTFLAGTRYVEVASIRGAAIATEWGSWLSRIQVGCLIQIENGGTLEEYRIEAITNPVGVTWHIYLCLDEDDPEVLFAAPAGPVNFTVRSGFFINPANPSIFKCGTGHLQVGDITLLGGAFAFIMPSPNVDLVEEGDIAEVLTGPNRGVYSVTGVSGSNVSISSATPFKFTATAPVIVYRVLATAVPTTPFGDITNVALVTSSSIIGGSSELLVSQFLPLGYTLSQSTQFTAAEVTTGLVVNVGTNYMLQDTALNLSLYPFQGLFLVVEIEDILYLGINDLSSSPAAIMLTKLDQANEWPTPGPCTYRIVKADPLRANVWSDGQTDVYAYPASSEVLGGIFAIDSLGQLNGYEYTPPVESKLVASFYGKLHDYADPGSGEFAGFISSPSFSFTPWYMIGSTPTTDFARMTMIHVLYSAVETDNTYGWAAASFVGCRLTITYSETEVFDLFFDGTMTAPTRTDVYNYIKDALDLAAFDIEISDVTVDDDGVAYGTGVVRFKSSRRFEIEWIDTSSVLDWYKDQQSTVVSPGDDNVSKWAGWYGITATDNSTYPGREVSVIGNNSMSGTPVACLECMDLFMELYSPMTGVYLRSRSYTPRSGLMRTDTSLIPLATSAYIPYKASAGFKLANLTTTIDEEIQPSFGRFVYAYLISQIDFEVSYVDVYYRTTSAEEGDRESESTAMDGDRLSMYAGIPGDRNQQAAAWVGATTYRRLAGWVGDYGYLSWSDPNYSFGGREDGVLFVSPLVRWDDRWYNTALSDLHIYYHSKPRTALLAYTLESEYRALNTDLMARSQISAVLNMTLSGLDQPAGFNASSTINDALTAANGSRELEMFDFASALGFQSVKSAAMPISAVLVASFMTRQKYVYGVGDLTYIPATIQLVKGTIEVL